MQLEIKNILVTQSIPLHKHPPSEPCRGCQEWSDSYSTASYLIDTTNWTCKGRVADGGLVYVDPVWWEKHCAEVAAKVRLMIQS